MKNLIKKIILVLLTYLGLAVLFGAIKSEFVLSHVNPAIIAIARISAYISLFISGLLAILFVAVLISGAYFAMVLVTGDEVDRDRFFSGIRFYIGCLILNELTKTILFYFLVSKHISLRISSMDNLSDLLQKTSWTAYSYASDFLFFLIGITAFFIALSGNKRYRWYQVFMPSAVFIVAFFISHSDFLIGTN